ncbi:MAG: translocation/assembly module TamB domain-containing protein [Taibaiella sp.]|nr:translocation/assembly module TamB domain-containing protein [Taibaiella sp.]
MRKAVKITLWILGSLLFLILGAALFLNSRWGQEIVRGKAEDFLNDKLKTTVKLGFIGVGFPKYVVLRDILVRDQKNDTLLSLGQLKVDVSMMKLLNHTVDVQNIILTDVTTHIYRAAQDTDYNFTYIIRAFAGAPKDNSADTNPKDSSAGKPWAITVDKVYLERIHARLNDNAGGMNMELDLNELSLRVKKLDLDGMRFHVKSLAMDGMRCSYLQDTSYLPAKPTDTSTTDLHLVADNVELAHINFRYSDNQNKLLFDLGLGKLELELKEFGLADNKVDVDKLTLNKTTATLVFGKTTRTAPPIDTTENPEATKGWNVKARRVTLDDVAFKMDNENELRVPRGMDYAHMDIKDLSLKLEDAMYNPDSLAGKLKSFSVKEQCGLVVKKLQTNFNYGLHGATLDKLYLETPNTTLQDHLEVHYTSMQSLKEQVGGLAVKLNIEESEVSMKDVLLFAPDLVRQPIFSANENETLALEIKADGTVGDLHIKKLAASGLKGTDILLNGQIKGLPDPDKLFYNLSIAKLQSCAADVNPFIPDSVKMQIRLPDRFIIAGQIAGTTTEYDADLNINSTEGMASIKGALALPTADKESKYDLSLQTAALNLGNVLRMDTLMGPVTINAAVKGTGFDPKKLAATVDASIISALVNGYKYHDVRLSANGQVGKWKLDLISDDPNARLQIKAKADMGHKYLSGDADIRIDSIDARALGFSNTELRARGLLHADVDKLNPDYPQAKIVCWEPVVTANGKRFFLDSLYIVSRPGADSRQNIKIDLGVLTASVTGKMPLTKVGAVVQNHIDRHYAILSDSTLAGALGRKSDSASMATARSADTAIRSLSPRDTLKIVADIRDKPMLRKMLPGLTSFDTIHIAASLSKNDLRLNMTMPNIVYENITIANGLLKVRSTDTAFTYNVTADQFNINDIPFWYADVSGRLHSQTISTRISLSDASEKERFRIAAIMRKDGNGQSVSLQPGLLLDYKEWTVNQPNKIYFGPDGIYVTSFGISNSGQSLAVNSVEARPNSPLRAEIKNFELSTFTRPASACDTVMLSGTANGVVNVQQFTPLLKADADLIITSLALLEDTVGDLHITVSNPTPEALDAKITLAGNGNDVSVTGQYFPKPTNGNDFHFDVNVKALAINTFEGVTGRQIRNSSGYLRGNLVAEGTAKTPVITGSLKTDNVVTTISQLNAVFKMPSEEIVFTKGKVSFNNFTIRDKENNRAEINGALDISDLTNMSIDMKLRANNWRALQSTQKDNKMYYGDLLLSANLSARGPLTAPDVGGYLKILKGTSVTLVNPQSDPAIESTRGIVRFVNMKDTASRNLLSPRKDTGRYTNRKKASSNVNVYVTADKDAEFTLVLDEASGDFLKVKGDANLNASINPGGDITLTGSYMLSDGAYQLNYNFVKRKFKIAKGSSITFAGDPVKNSQLDITAVYEARIPPYDLVQRQVTDPAQLNYYKQRIPFDVKLFMQGPILSPHLSFDIAIPEGKPVKLAADQLDLVQGKLAQVRTDTSELNKQVFAVLVLNRFVSDEPFNSGAGSSAQFMAMQSVSTFLGEQLNRAANSVVKGVDFSVDLATTEDYTTGDLRQRTDLNLAASKQFLDDRLKLTVGNNFELEGPQTQNSTQSAYVPTNLAADYMLTSDGKYILRAYRQAYDVGVLQGFVTETGLNFIVSLDYNNFKNAFKSRRQNGGYQTSADTDTSTNETEPRHKTKGRK